MKFFTEEPGPPVTPQSGLAWELFEAFFRARDAFMDIYDNYEDRVMAYATSRGVDRLVLRLSAAELSGLFDFKKIEVLREEHLEPLKEVSHQLFRKGETTDPLDRLLSEAFHESSILKEEQYKLLTFAMGYEGAEIKSFLDEIHHAFPMRVHRLHAIFEAALQRLFELLPQTIFREDGIFLRSLYLFGDEVLADFFHESLDEFWTRIFVETGAPEGYLTVAQSFYGSGFRERAYEAIRKAHAALSSMSVSSQRLRAVAAAIESMSQSLELSLALRGELTNEQQAATP